MTRPRWQDGTVPKPRLLILSFSPIGSDARVLKQVSLFAPDYAVTTCGFGPAPDGNVEHIRIPDDASSLRVPGRLVTARLYSQTYAKIPAVAAARTLLAPYRQGARAGSTSAHEPFDVILANDVEAVPLGLWLKPQAGVHADLHEYAPRLQGQDAAWMRVIAPFNRWLCRKFVTRAASVTTVCEGLAREYHNEFGIDAGVVTNAAPYADLSIGEVGDPIRLVHSGAGLRNRNLHLMIDAIALCQREVQLDLFLTANHPDVITDLRAQAAVVPGVRVHDPVPYSELIATLNRYDVGVFVLPPVNFNYEQALPNKLFDYVQARLAIVVGPSPEMARVVRGYGLGLVAEDFSAAALAEQIDALTPESIAQFKKRAEESAHELSSQEQNRGWADAISALAGVAAAPGEAS